MNENDATALLLNVYGSSTFSTVKYLGEFEGNKCFGVINTNVINTVDKPFYVLIGSNGQVSQAEMPVYFDSVYEKSQFAAIENQFKFFEKNGVLDDDDSEDEEDSEVELALNAAVKGYNPYRDEKGRFASGDKAGVKKFAKKGSRQAKIEAAKKKLADKLKQREETEKKRLAVLRKEAEEMVNAMKPDDEYLNTRLKELEKDLADLNVQTKKGPIKKPDRMVEKTFEEPEGFKMSEMKDVVRGTLIMQSLEDKEAIIKRIEKDFKIARVKDLGSIDGDGYFDTKVNIELPSSGYVGEIILLVPEMYNSKAKPTVYKETGHDLYDIIRDRKSSPQAIREATDKSTKIYAAAKKDYIARVKSEKILKVDL